MSERKKPKKVFSGGAIAPEKIATSIANHQSKTDITEHNIFLAQVPRTVDGQEVNAIDFLANEESAAQTLHDIREEAFQRFNLSCLHMYHSLGPVNVGEIHFFVFTSSPDKQVASEACNYLVEEFNSKIEVARKTIV